MGARDARKKREEERRRREAGRQKDKEGSRDPNDPANRLPDGGSPKDSPENEARRNGVPPWVVALPPEVRDALAGGRAEDIPERYRHLIRAYTLWLQKNQKNGR